MSFQSIAKSKCEACYCTTESCEMPQWSSRLLSSSSRNKLGDPEEVCESSNSVGRVRTRFSESPLKESVRGFSSPSHANNGCLNDTKISENPIHNRSMSHPFPSLFSGKKKRLEIEPSSTEIGLKNDNAHSPVSNRECLKINSLKKKSSNIDLLTGKCMTCDSTVRWPKELSVFRCTVCLTINDLKPIVLDTQPENGYKHSSMSKPREPNELQTGHQSKTNHYEVKQANLYSITSICRNDQQHCR